MQITASWDLSSEYWKEAYDAIMEARRVRQILLGIFLGIGFASFVILSVEVFGFDVLNILYVLFAMFILYGAYLLWYPRSWARRNAEDFSGDGRCEAVFSQAGLSLTGRLAHSQFRWDAIKAVTPTKRGLVLTLRGGTTFIYIPDKALMPSSTKQDILSLRMRATLANSAKGAMA